MVNRSVFLSPIPVIHPSATRHSSELVNEFICSEVLENSEDPGAKVLTRNITAKFYENDSKIQLKVVTYVDTNKEVLDRRLYWFDEENNENPEDNSAWQDILENMDIFLDE